MSFWEDQYLLNQQDIIIIGAGITGIQAAIHAKRRFPRRSVLVLERGALPAGASTKNAGFACIGSLSEMAVDIREIGSDRTFALIERRFQGLQLLRESVADHLMDYRPCGGVEVFGQEQDDLFLLASEVMEDANRAISTFSRVSQVFTPWNSQDIFPGFNRGWKSALEGQINPALLMNALHDLARSLEVRILNGVEVKMLNHEDPRGVALYTADFGEILAEQVIVATNGFARDLLPDIALRPVRNQVLVTEPVEDLAWEGTFHHDRGYVYFRNIGKRVLLGGFRNMGGEAEETDRFGITDHIFSRQMAFLREDLGVSADITHRWSGVLGVGDNREPIVAEVFPGVYAAVRLGGMGVALGSLLGKEVSELLQ